MNKQLHTKGSEDVLLLQPPNDFHSLAFTYHSKISPQLLQQAKCWQLDSPRVPAGFKGSAAKPDAGKQGRVEAALAHQCFPGCAAPLDALIIPTGTQGAATSGVAFW